MRILIPVFVREFYLAHAGFFLLVVAFAGGFMRSYDHVALAEFFISSPLVLIIPIGFWVLYVLKVMNFNRDRTTQNENEFIFCFMLFPLSKQWWMIVRILLIQFLPVPLYASFLCLLAAKHGIMSSVIVIILSLMVLVVISAYHLIWSLRHPNYERKISFVSRFLNRVNKPFPLFFIEWITRHEFVMSFGTKILSGSIMLVTTALYKTDAYDLRLLSMGLIIAGGANTGIIHALHHFENFQLGWLKGLPIPFIKRIGFSLITIGVILLPEIFLLTRHFVLEQYWYGYVGSALFLVSVPLLFYGLLYVKDRNQQEIMTIVFYCGIAWFVLVLFNVPILVLGIVNTITGLVLWKRFYYSFEYISGK